MDNHKDMQTFKLRNCILCIIQVWLLFCSVWVYISLHFLPILLVKLVFRLSVFWFLMFLFLWFLVFGFSVLRFEFNVISKNLTTFFFRFQLLFGCPTADCGPFLRDSLTNPMLITAFSTGWTWRSPGAS